MPPRSPFARSLLLMCVLISCFSSVFGAVAEPVVGQAAEGTPRAAPRTVTPGVAAPSSASLDSTDIAVPRDGRFAYSAAASLGQMAPYLQVRLRIRRPSGRLLFQKTHVRNDLPAGRYDFTFTRELADLDLEPGLYPVELAVLSEGNPPDSWTVPEVMRVYDPEMQPLRIAPVVRVSSAPSIDPEGNFVADPGVETVARDEVVALADAIVRDPALRATLAIAPELLEEWKRISTGYSFAGPAGIEKVEADGAVPQAYARALRRLKEALATRRLELLNVPYADPDIAGLSSIRRESDLGEHYELGTAAYQYATEQTPTAGTLTARGCLTAQTAEEARKHGVGYAVVAPRYVRSAEGTAPAGVLSSTRIPLTLLATDAEIGRLFGSTSSTETLDTLFTRALKNAEVEATAIPVLIEVGPGRKSSVSQFVRRVAVVEDEPWVTFVTAGEAAKTPARMNGYALAQRATIMRTTPTGWWSSIAASRRYAEALEAILEEGGQEARTAVTNSLIAQDAAWAGPDGQWALADRGRSFASAAVRSAEAVFDTVAVSANDLTLSGARGEVPFSITNESGRSLNVVLRATASNIALRTRQLREATLLPAENYVTVPVDLRASTGGKLRLQVVAGTLVIASSTVTVRASYLDRLAIVGAIVLLLGAMLYFIRRRVRSAERTADPE